MFYKLVNEPANILILLPVAPRVRIKGIYQPAVLINKTLEYVTF